MERRLVQPRQNWQMKVEEHGLIYHTFNNVPYWNESAFYEFTASEIDELESASEELHRMCLQAVQHVIDAERFSEFGIPYRAIQPIKDQWLAQPPTLYGRFDLGYDGKTPPKLFEYNADTPTALLEAAVIQWQWMQEVYPNSDQFNSIWEGLIERWPKLGVGSGPVHFASQDHWEDVMTVAVLRDTAEATGIQTEDLLMEEIGWNSEAKEFRDLDERPIRTLFKLYPWEFLVKEAFGGYALQNLEKTRWIEPVWKMILSNKAILAVLWELFPGHPNLLPAYLDGPRDMTHYVVKPILGREGSNISIVGPGLGQSTDGPYAEEKRIWQQYCPLPEMFGKRPVIGSWMIGDEPRGIGVRETDRLITDDLAQFVPHRIA